MMLISKWPGMLRDCCRSEIMGVSVLSLKAMRNRFILALHLAVLLSFALPCSPDAREADPDMTDTITEEFGEIAARDQENRVYTIRAGDVLLISVWQEPDLKEEVIVRPDGRISFPMVGDIMAEGFNFDELKAELTRRLKEFLKYPDVSISLKKSGGRKVVVLGEVVRPGVYTVTGMSTAMEAIAMAWGYTKNALPSNVIIIRGGDMKARGIRTNLTEAVSNFDSAQNITLHAEDIVYVPGKISLEGRKVIVLGEVKKPGVYTVTGQNKVLEAVALAGGFTLDAVSSSVILVREGFHNPQGMRLDLSNAIKETELSQNAVLQSEDIVYVPRKFIADVNYFMRQILGPISGSANTVNAIE